MILTPFCFHLRAASKADFNFKAIRSGLPATGDFNKFMHLHCRPTLFKTCNNNAYIYVVINKS